MTLTDTTVRTIKPAPGRVELLIADGDGLYLRVRAGKRKISRAWQYRAAGPAGIRIRTLGTYPALTLKDARARVAALARRNIDCPTVKEAADEWFSEVVEPSRKSSEATAWYIERIVGAIGGKRLDEVEPRTIADTVRAYRDEAAKHERARAGGRAAAGIMLVTLKGVFNYAVIRGWITTSPAAQITSAVIGARSKPRERVLSEDEIRWVVASDLPQSPVWRFLLATGMRIGEAYGGHRDGQYWVVPAEHSKNGKEHRVWLSPFALTQIERQPWLPKWAVQLALNTFKMGWSCHDLRRTFSTRMNGEMGVPPHIVEKMLSHTLGGVMGVYNQAEYLDERREALERWSTWLEGFLDRPGGVVPLRAVG